jgi:hypothetical protein
MAGFSLGTVLLRVYRNAAQPPFLIDFVWCQGLI